MPWCPNCKLEYVKGCTVCPDCKCDLVEALEEESVPKSIQEFSKEDIESIVNPYLDEIPSEEEQLEMLERIKKIKEAPVYKSKEERFTEYKSGAGVLLACGFIGALVLILGAVGVLNFPLSGFFAILMYTVMGLLFFVFLVCGKNSITKANALKPLVLKEKEAIQKILEFIENKKALGEYSLNKESEDYETLYLNLSETVVNDVNEAFPDLEPGFSFYVVDRFAGDILDEN